MAAMTLVLAVACGDGLVIAGDSRTSSPASAGPARVLSDRTHKVFALGQVAVATYGLALVLKRNIASHLAELTAGAPSSPTPSEVVGLLDAHFRPLVQEHLTRAGANRPSDALGFLVAGYEGGVGSVHEVVLPSGENRVVASTASEPPGGAAWRGQTDVVERLITGVDRRRLTRIAQRAGKEGPLEDLDEALRGLGYLIRFDAMNLQDAVDYAVLAIRTTVEVQRLTDGTVAAPGAWPGVGGPIEVATVTSPDGLRWVARSDVTLPAPERR